MNEVRSPMWMNIAANEPYFVGELAMPLSRHHKGMKIPSSPPGLATFPLSNFWRGGLRG
jgi:hypothetical protein